MTTKGAVANETCRAVVLHALRTRGATGSTIESAECETAVDTELLREAESSREAGLAKGAFYSAWGNKVIAAGCPRRQCFFRIPPAASLTYHPHDFPGSPLSTPPDLKTPVRHRLTTIPRTPLRDGATAQRPAAAAAD